MLCTSWQREANVNNSKVSALLRTNWNFGIFSHDLPKKPYKTRTCAVLGSNPSFRFGIPKFQFSSSCVGITLEHWNNFTNP